MSTNVEKYFLFLTIRERNSLTTTYWACWLRSIQETKAGGWQIQGQFE